MKGSAPLAMRRPPTDVARLLDAVWPGCTIIPGNAESDRPRVAALKALPSARNVRLLVPAFSRRAASMALRQFNDGMTQPARVRKAMVGAALATPFAPLIGTRLDVLVGDTETSSPVVDEIRGVFDGNRVEIAVFVGERLRPNRKPVLQILSERGDVLGYAKVGWDALTKRLVSNEADTLRSFMASPPATFRVPRILHQADVGGAHLTVLSPLPHALFRRGNLGATPPLDAVREIAFRSGRVVEPLSRSGYERAVRDRIEALEDEERRSILVRRFDTVIDASTDGDVAFGSWHGDWTPWNMARSRTGLDVWDWERSGGSVPVGLDVLHHRFLFRWRDGADANSLASDTLDASRTTLGRLGLDHGGQRRLLSLYLYELLLRVEEGRDAGRTVPRALSSLEHALDSHTVRP